MDCQHLHHLQRFLGTDYPCALLQPLRSNLVVYPAHRADIPLHATTVLEESGKNARHRHPNVLRIRIHHQHATYINALIMNDKNERNERNYELTRIKGIR